MYEMVTNHLDKAFVTNDIATIVNELKIQYLAAMVNYTTCVKLLITKVC